MDKEEVIKLIKGRIEDEYRKHPLLDWARIAAGKIYTQWFEYFNNENKDLSLEEYWMHQEKSAKAFIQGYAQCQEDNFLPLIEEYREKELPNRNVPYHYEAEISSGLNGLIEFIKNKQE